MPASTPLRPPSPGSALASPAPPPPPPPPRGAEPGPEPDELAAAMWLGVLGSGLVATAALIVGFAGRETLGAAGPAAGLIAAAGTAWYLSRRLRALAPMVADVLEHLARLVAAVAGGAAVAALAPWHWVVGVLGLTTALATSGWRLGGRWARAGLYAVAVGSGLVSIAATTVLPLGPMLAAASTLVMVWPTGRWAAERCAASLLLAFTALAAPLGGLPGRWRVGPGTLSRLGLRDEVLAWAAPGAAIVAGAVFVVWACRQREPSLLHAAVAGVSANTLVGVGSDDWPQWLPAIWLAVLFLGVQALARGLSSDPFWRQSFAPVARGIAVLSMPVIAFWSPALASAAASDGGSALAAIAPSLLAVGFALVPTRRDERELMTTAAAAMVLLAAFAATASLTATAAVAVLLLAWLVAVHPSTVTTSLGAVVAWSLSTAAQLTSPPVIPTALAGATLAIVGFAIGRRARVEAILALVIGATLTAMAAVADAGDDVLLAAALVGAGVAAAALVASDRTDLIAAAIVPIYLIALAVLDFVGQLGNGAHPGGGASSAVVATASVAATAGAVVVVVSAAAWWRGDERAAHGVAIGAVWAAATAAVAVGVTLPWVVGVALVGGVALAGAAFSRSVFGVADTAAMAVLLTAFTLGFQDDPGAISLAWTAMTAFGAVVTLHGLSRLDVLLAVAGATTSVVSAGVLMNVVGADHWVVEQGERTGMTPGDMAMTAVVAILAGFGLVLARLRPESTSWEVWAPPSGIAATYLLATIAVGSEPDVRLLIALSGGCLLVAAGAWGRAAAPLVIGTLTVIGAVGLASWTTLESLPAWAWMAAGGAALLGVAVLVERRGRDGDATHAVKRVLTTFR